RLSDRVFSTDLLNGDREARRSSSYVQNLTNELAQESFLNQMLYVDSKTWLPDDLLLKADKMTMANSVELRVPLLDHAVLEFAASLPGTFKVDGGETKRLLKAAFAQALPSEILSRKKAGFPIPYGKWLAGPLWACARDILQSTGGFVRQILDARS